MLLLEQRAHVGHDAGHSGRSRGQRAGQQGSAAFALASFKIAIAGADAVFAGL